MVSKARLDLPEPDSPVMTVRLSRGSSSDTFFRLCTRAPCTAIVVRGAGLAGAALALPAIGHLGGVEERQFFHLDIALPGEPHGQRRLADQPLVSQVLTRAGYAFDAVVLAEVVLDFRRRT